MPATHKRDFLQKLRILLFFIEFNIWIFIMLCRQKTTHLDPGPAPALQPAPSPQPPARRRRKPPNPWVMPWIFQREERGCYRTLWPTSYRVKSDASRILLGCHPHFFYLNDECIHRIKKEVTNLQEALRSWIETDNNSETPGNRRDVHFFTVSLAGWPNHHLYIC